MFPENGRKFNLRIDCYAQLQPEHANYVYRKKNAYLACFFRNSYRIAPQVGILPAHLLEEIRLDFALSSAWQHWRRSRAPASSGNCKNHTVFHPINVPKASILPAHLLEEIWLDFALAVLGSTGADREHLPVVATAKTIPYFFQ